GAVLTFNFAEPLTSEEQQILSDAGFTSVGVDSADWVHGTTINLNGRIAENYFVGIDATTNTSDETLALLQFVASGSAGSLNDAGLIVRSDADSGGGGGIVNSTVSIAGNTIVGETTGNDATNATAFEATAVNTTNDTQPGGN